MSAVSAARVVAAAARVGAARVAAARVVKERVKEKATRRELNLSSKFKRLKTKLKRKLRIF